ncbi:MAG: acyl-CoA thioesterase [Steroidobacteraceae bacterium]
MYYPRIVAWFNDTEHDFFRTIGYPIDQMIRRDRTTFVMGEIHFRFIGPAAYGDRIATTVTLTRIGERTLHWACKARNAVAGAPITEGKATRVFARINEDGTLNSAAIPDAMRQAMMQSGQLSHLKQKIEDDPEYRHREVASPARPRAQGEGVAPLPRGFRGPEVQIIAGAAGRAPASPRQDRGDL